MEPDKQLKDLILKDSLNNHIFALARRLSADIYLVGGYLRDLIIGKINFDRDFVICGVSAISFGVALTESIGGNLVMLDEERDIVRVILRDKATVDLSHCVGEGIEEDLLGRDFTVDALAWHKDRGIIDVSGGINDIKNKVIRAINEKNLLSDPVRMLRAYRIAAEISGVIEPETEGMIKRFSHMITYSAWERITDELFKLLRISISYPYLKMSTETGLFKAIIPEIKDTANAISVLKDVEMLIEEINISPVEYGPSGAISYNSLIKFSSLLEELSMEVNNITQRLRLSNRDRRFIKKIVTSTKELQGYLKGKIETTDLFLYFNKIGESAKAVAICTVARLYRNSSFEYKKERLYHLMQMYNAYLERAKRLPIISGHDIIKILSIPEGPRIGRILKKINDSYLIGDVNSREDAIKLLKNGSF